MNTAEHTYVYFVQGTDGGPVKVGRAIDPQRRLEGLRCGSPVPLQLIGVIRCDPYLETVLHARWARHRLHGEWFSPDPEILAYVAKRGSAYDTRDYRGRDYVSYAEMIALAEHAHAQADEMEREYTGPALRCAENQFRACWQCHGAVSLRRQQCEYCNARQSQLSSPV